MFELVDSHEQCVSSFSVLSSLLGDFGLEESAQLRKLGSFRLVSKRSIGFQFP